MEFDKRYKQLNDSQRQAVDQIDGPVMVIAGPGTGKTELLSIRVANILQKTDTLPESILCLTFTENGAAAMRERLVGIIGKDAYKVAIHTFHSFGTDIINKNREYFYNNALFSPADDLSQYEILKSIFDDLDYKNPLSSTMNDEYTYLRSAKDAISELKRAGGMNSDELLAVIQQDEESLDIAEEILFPILTQRVSQKVTSLLAEALPRLHQEANKFKPLYEVTPLISVLANSLELAVERAVNENSTKPVTVWKNEWTKKNDQKELIFSNRENLNKLKHLSLIYHEYLRRMEAASLFDYDDMILQVVHAIEKYDGLRANLQEKYLYLMVDEFQDTNVAQMRILHSLTDNPVNEGRPNLLTVGDDDQAIYGFQGADVSNMISFRNQYPEAKLIVLTENYRSANHILESSRQVITQGTDRLEAVMPELNKSLTANRQPEGEVRLVRNITPQTERQWVTDEIKGILATNPQTKIAVLGRTNNDLQQILPHLNKAGIPVRYEKQDNALDQPPIKALILLARVVVALAQNRHDEANAHLPELLAHPAWGLSPRDIWKLSLDAYTSRQNWMQVMETTPAFMDIHQRLVQSAVDSQNQSLEKTLDNLIGRGQESPSPLLDYYFGEKALNENPEQYVDYLSALRAIRNKISEYHSDTAPNLETFLNFVDNYKRLNLAINTPRLSRGTQEDAVDLMTAHRSKGLEYDHVYIIHSLDNAWGQSTRTRSRNIRYPQNLPLAPVGDTADERLRLFYVAMTRARSNLTLTFSEKDEKNKSTFVADFITATDLEAIDAPEPSISEQVEIAETEWSHDLTKTNSDLKTILQPHLETYRLSATSFTSFLDVTKGGPQNFLLDKLLRFPRASSPAIAYGNAVHYALQQAHIHFAARGEAKPTEDIMHDFEQALQRERLEERDREQLLQKGSDHIPAFLASPDIHFNSKQKAELAFSHQEVQLDGARLTGKIDVAEANDDDLSMTVTDYKTGKPPLSWSGSSLYDKVKLHQYRQQLLFYKILVEQSRDYGKYKVEEGRLVFVQPTSSGKISILDMNFSPEEVERTKALIKGVWRHVLGLDLPDISSYPENLNGILAFEQDIIDGNL